MEKVPLWRESWPAWIKEPDLQWLKIIRHRAETDLGIGGRDPGAQSPHSGSDVINGLAEPDLPHPQPVGHPCPGYSVQSRAPCSWLSSLQAWAQATLPVRPGAAPGSCCSRQGHVMWVIHTRGRPNQLLHSSSPRPSQKAQSRLLGLESLQHRAALFPGSGEAGGWRELGRRGAWAQGGFPCGICPSCKPSPLPVLAPVPELKFTSPSFRTDFELGCWFLYFPLSARVI